MIESAQTLSILAPYRNFLNSDFVMIHESIRFQQMNVALYPAKSLYNHIFYIAMLRHTLFRGIKQKQNLPLFLSYLENRLKPTSLILKLSSKV